MTKTCLDCMELKKCQIRKILGNIPCKDFNERVNLQEELKKMTKTKCEFCDFSSESGFANTKKLDLSEIYLEDTNYLWIEGEEYDERFKINFCPFCGRNLKEE